MAPCIFPKEPCWFISFFLILPFFSIPAITKAQGIDKSNFYAAISSDQVQEINAQLLYIKSGSFDEKEAYEGALLMKKSGLVGNAKEKLSLFRLGREKLERSISRDYNNVEYRFLRIIIQEHAPKILKYRNELQEDSLLVRARFKNLPPFLQQIIQDYSKKSKQLKSPIG